MTVSEFWDKATRRQREWAIYAAGHGFALWPDIASTWDDLRREVKDALITSWEQQ